MIEFKEIVDLAVPLKSMATPMFTGHPQPLRTTFTTIDVQGFQSYVWFFAEHSGTHVDAPAHMTKEGMTVDQVPVKQFVSRGVVLDFAGKPRYQITKSDIEKALESTGHRKDVDENWILLFYCGYTAKSDSKDWLENPDLTEEACKFIIELGVRAIGIDALGPDHAPWIAHHLLLPNNVVIFENLSNLDKLIGKEFVFVGTPISLFGGTAGLTRPVALIL